MRLPLFAAILSSIPAVAADPFFGSWQLDPQRSQIRTGLRVAIEMRGKAFRYSSGGVTFTALFDGGEYPLQGVSTRVTVSLKRIDDHTIERVFRRDGKPVSGATMSVSPDGRFLTVSIQRLDPEGHGRKLANIYQRAGPPSSDDPFAGDWERNPLRTIGNSPSRIAFSPHGAGGLRFDGDSVGYSALADGKDYPVSGAIVADSVRLTRVDPRTLEELWKSGSRIAATVRRVLSADGQEMTATVVGTTPQGDHFENIFFYTRTQPP